MFENVAVGIEWIETRPKFRPKTSLIHMKKAIDILPFSFDHIKKIHVAGTNGKGSTCAYLTHILVEFGLKIGTYTSPYLVRFHERLMIDGVMINDEDLLASLNWIYDFHEIYQKTYTETLSFFELLTLMGFKYFHQKQVDVMIIEVGLGGLLDATNVLNYDVSLITNIGYDHMKQLGSTLEEIAYNKLGVVKTNNHLISTVDASLKDLFKSYTDSKKATFKRIQVSGQNDDHLTFLFEDVLYHTPLLGIFQKQNAGLAIAAIKYLYPNITKEIIQEGLNKTKWSGRLEMVIPHVYVDGAHNIHAVEGLVQTIKHEFKDKRVYILFSSLSDKEPRQMIQQLKPYVTDLIVTSFEDSRFESLAYLKEKYVKDPLDALRILLKMRANDDIIIVMGSLHFIGFMKRHVLPKL